MKGPYGWLRCVSSIINVIVDFYNFIEEFGRQHLCGPIIIKHKVGNCSKQIRVAIGWRLYAQKKCSHHHMPRKWQSRIRQIITEYVGIGGKNHIDKRFNIVLKPEADRVTSGHEGPASWRADWLGVIASNL